MSVDSLASASVAPRNKSIYRVLDVDENIWKTQNQWQTPGRFLLEKRDQLGKFEKIITKVKSIKFIFDNILFIIN